MRFRSKLVLAFCALSVLSRLRAEDKVAAGKYLVEEIAKCQECHTPRLESREFDKTKWLKGAVMEYAPIKPVQGWHKTSPDLTPSGRLWSRWKEEALRKYLETGIAPNGKPADPPMPAYKMKKADAEAVVEYLKTLP
ncbi:MAG TPA: cytochrome c [Bryobacteraceae bacterium]|nr:cytochrome c [Bryobacteraceae bacterium]